MQVDICLQKITLAATKFDTVALEDSLRNASELGVPANQPAWAYKLFLDLQSEKFVLDKSSEMQRLGSDKRVNLEMISNLEDQLRVLGYDFVSRGNATIAKMLTKEGASVFDSADATSLAKWENL